MAITNIVRTVTDMRSVTVDTSVANSVAIPMGQFSGGSFRVRSGSIATATFHGADNVVNSSSGTADGTFEALYDNTGAAVTMAVTTGRRYQLPDACFGVHMLKLTGDAAGVIDITLVG